MDTLLHVGLSNALAATLLAVPVALIARVGRRPALAHALWVLVLLKLVTPPLFAVTLPWSDPLAAGSQEIVPPRADVGAAPLPQPVDLPPLLADLGAEDVAEEAHEAPPPRRRADPLAAPRALAGPDGKSVLLTLWLTGSALWWLVACLRVARFRRLLRHTTPAPAEVQAQAQRLAELLGLRRCPGVSLVAARVSPLLWALGRVPWLLLPADLWQALTPEQRDTLLVHELAHLRRRDHWVRRLELFVLGLFWWHPVAWWARHELAEAEEACCDAWVLWALPECGPAYAAALVETVAFLSPARRPVPVAASGAGRVKTLKRRLTMILQRPSPRALSSAGLFAVLGLGGLLLPLLPTWADQQAAESRGAPAPPAVEKVPVPLEAPKAPAVPAPKFPPPRDAEKLPPAAPAAPAEAPARSDRAEQIQKARDDIELLDAQLEVKRAQLKAAKAALEAAKLSLVQFRRLYESGAIKVEMVTKAEADARKQEAEVSVKEAELREPQVRLTQAMRRLAALQRQAGGSGLSSSQLNWAAQLFDDRVRQIRVTDGGRAEVRFQLTNTTGERVRISSVRNSSGGLTAVATRTTLAPEEKAFIDVIIDGRRFNGTKHFTVFVAFDRPRAAEVRLMVQAVKAETAPVLPPAPAGDRERLKSLEDKLDRLLKEVEEMRKRLPPERAKKTEANPWTKEREIWRINERVFIIPYQVDPEKARDIKKIELYCSQDQGGRWEQFAVLHRDDRGLMVRVPQDGMFWFRVAVIDPTGRRNPVDISRSAPTLKVLVNTGDPAGPPH